MYCVNGVLSGVNGVIVLLNFDENLRILPDFDEFDENLRILPDFDEFYGF